jgi:hypothetical protein
MQILLRGLNFLRIAYAGTRRYVGYRVFEKPLGLETSTPARLGSLGLADAERIDYEPSPWLVLRRALPKAEVCADDVFLDFGSGKGPIVLQAAQYPFRRVIGVELAPELHAIAQRNVARALPTLACRNIELVNSDALEYTVPDDVTVVYFYNPFLGSVFARVVRELQASLRRRPRTLRIVYMNPVEESALIDAGARIVKVVRGLRPGRKWARLNTVKVFELAADIAEVSSGAGGSGRS